MAAHHHLQVELVDHVATLTFQCPPQNYVSPALVGDLADALTSLDNDDACRVVVLASRGKNFCAGADFSTGVADARVTQAGSGSINPIALYRQAMRLFDTRKPLVVALQGAAIGAGAGLALVADFRIAADDARISFNFNRIGIHPGFGLSFTLPRVVGQQKAALLFYTGRRIVAQEAHQMGLVDDVVAAADLLQAAQRLAADIAVSSPVAVQSTRATLRAGLADQVRQANARELSEQQLHFRSSDFEEGVRAMSERRPPVFGG